ncbi:hypothetical protein BU23DRAFT_548996 [Bimuria novae-zelandiae CBS 107.79]|uniref:SigF-like NTF2-like domain-containing protein n=1 Tax=Bimuria novae-zelandiae CBS 107.79 TaxID=1447943 RepID=A0A6A5VRC5_9PLEO|nr:hypothetical protein BU23DRAFT_548996 [Bimuria novae-zelandiae CBS 107.79]
MENPVKEISGVIHLLTQSPPSVQRETIETYFTHNAAFTHPFCRTGSSENSRFLIRAIYRWYKILSPKIELTVNSVAYDEHNLILYVNISQSFGLWFVPFHRARVNLTTVLKLERNRGDGKYYIQRQDDLYQTDEFVKFLIPPSWILMWIWQFWATLFCVLGAIALWLITYVEEQVWEGSNSRKSWKEAGREGKKKAGDLLDGIEMQDLERKAVVNKTSR